MKPKLALRKGELESPGPFAPALALLAAGSLDQGATLLRELHAKYAKDPTGANLLGTVHFNAGRIDEARACFASASSLAPEVSAFAYNEGAALLTGGRPREAFTAFVRSLHGDALLPEAHYWAWSAFGNLGVIREAISRLRKALDEDPAQAQVDVLPDRLELGSVTLCAIDCAAPALAMRALKRSMSQCRFGAVKLFTSKPCADDDVETVFIDHIAGIEGYSRFVMKSLYQHIGTQFALVTQWDGYVVNPRAWTDAFLDYDYIGAKWTEENVRRDGFPAGHNVGNGGFSLRSDFYLGAGGDPHLEKTHPEDTHLCGTYRPYLEGTCGIKYATAEVADRFSFELDIPESPPFGFHGSFNLCRFEPDPKWMRFEFLGRDFPAT